MTAKTVDGLLEAVAPLEEQEVRELMNAEAAKHRPNESYRCLNWVVRHPRRLFGIFVVVAAVYFVFFSAREFSAGALLEMGFTSLFVVCFAYLTANELAKGPAEWRTIDLGGNDPRLFLALQAKTLQRVAVQYPDAIVELEVLQRTTHHKELPLATVLWLVYPDHTGTLQRRGIFAW